MAGTLWAPVALLAALAVATAAGADVREQDACAPPPVVKPGGPNIFSPRQEMDLADALHEHLQSQGLVRVIEDEELTSPLSRIGERLARHVPGGEMPFRFALLDTPEVTAAALPGGRIYVTRKLVASVRSEDELAGVLAHEMAHVLAGDAAVDFTRFLRESLGVTRLGDREDVFRSYHRLLENIQVKPEAYRVEADDGPRQVAADAIAVAALARAGYQPQAVADLWDRVTGTRGRTGNWLSDLLGLTRPEAKRLRRMLKAQAAVPAACIEPRSASAVADFARWQAAVVAYRGPGRRESVPGLVWKKSLDPPLQPQIEHIRFSPDGRLVLAQDDASVFVLSVDPFALRFRVEAPDAAPAQFSPDSAALVFHTDSLRVEKWDAASGERVSVQELTRLDPCLEAILSPDGRFLACYDIRFRLSLVEVETGQNVFEKPSFSFPGRGALLVSEIRRRMGIEEPGSALIEAAFSPDGRYFLAGARGAAPVAFDLQARRPLALAQIFRDLTPLGFAFVGPDRLAGIDVHDGRNSALVRFPSGEVVKPLPLRPGRRLAAATAGDYLLLRPGDKYAVTVLSLDSSEAVLASRSSALDLFRDRCVNEVGDGRLDLRRCGGDAASERIATVELPRRSLGVLRAASLAGDLRWLAVSGRSRGAVWDLERAARVMHVRGFNGAHIDPKGPVMYADFRAVGAERRSLAAIELASRRLVEERELDGSSVQLGDTLLRLRRDAQGTGRITGLESADARSGAALWSRALPAATVAVFWGNAPSALTLAWRLADSAARDEIRRNPALGSRLPALKKDVGVWLLEVVDRRTGKTLGAVQVDTGRGSFAIEGVHVFGDVVVVDDSLGRVLVYSLATGELRGRLFGNRPVLAESGRVLSIESGAGRLAIHDVARLQKGHELVFSSPVAFAGFSPDGSRLLVLTAEQTAFLVAVGFP